ncbi:MAG: nitroreductase family protein [Clostridiales bacterium]|nr:nitroreductase family protein [Clostridiales bacterium]
MDAIENIMTRRSVRNFTDRHISEEDLTTILKAGMSGPTCTNARQWTFLVVRDRETLDKMAAANGRPGEPVKKADVGILVCGDMERAFKPAPDYWIIDAAIAAQNMILAAHALGIGSVWLGTYPQMERVKAQAELFSLPESAIPHSLIAFGYPDPDAPEHPPMPPKKEGDPEMPPPPPPRPGFPKEKGAFEPGRIHYEKW